jgi:hypothetical protein
VHSCREAPEGKRGQHSPSAASTALLPVSHRVGCSQYSDLSRYRRRTSAGFATGAPRMTIRWKVGAFRTWVAFALIWVSAAAWINYGPQRPGPWDLFAELPFPRSEAACKEAAAREPSVNISRCIENASLQNWRDGEHVAWTILPPTLVLLLGVLVGWVVSGFRSETQT